MTQPANGMLSQWGARAVLVDKVENPKPTDEPRLTFDYSRVTEDLPGTLWKGHQKFTIIYSTLGTVVCFGGSKACLLHHRVASRGQTSICVHYFP